MPGELPFIVTRSALSRRCFLQGAGLALALPLLDALTPAFARTAQRAAPRRIFTICNNLGLLGDQVYPTEAGRDYQLTPYLTLLKAHRNDFTVFSGVSHPGTGSFRNTISLDQFIAERIGSATRFPSLTLAVNSRTLSYNGSGVGIPPEDRAAEVFRQMFVQGTAAQIEAKMQELDAGRSILDAVSVQAQRLQRTIGTRDAATAECLRIRKRVARFVPSTLAANPLALARRRRSASLQQIGGGVGCVVLLSRYMKAADYAMRRVLSTQGDAGGIHGGAGVAGVPFRQRRAGAFG